MANFISMKQQDMWGVPVSVRVIPVNTVGVMGAGLAKQAAERVPGLLEAYKAECAKGFNIGELFLFTPEDEDCMYVCFPTKGDWKDYATVEHIVMGLQALYDQLGYWSAMMAEESPKAKITVSIPPVGAGLGNFRRRNGPDQPRIQPDLVRTLIQSHLELVPDVTVFIF